MLAGAGGRAASPSDAVALRPEGVRRGICTWLGAYTSTGERPGHPESSAQGMWQWRDLNEPALRTRAAPGSGQAHTRHGYDTALGRGAAAGSAAAASGSGSMAWQQEAASAGAHHRASSSRDSGVATTQAAATPTNARVYQDACMERAIAGVQLREWRRARCGNAWSDGRNGDGGRGEASDVR